MELIPHDLLEIRAITDLVSFTEIPEWVENAIASAPFVVVRRAQAGEGLVAVGVRGQQRNERFASFLPVERIIRRISPEQLSREREWVGKSKDIFKHLELINRIMNKYSLVWGPTGSVGFELASKKDATTESSDIDIVIRLKKELTKELANSILTELNNEVKIRVDVQVDMKEGGFSLTEYATNGEKPILIRTINGPKLMKIECLD
ncbi:malonate decarboxylase holo-ACP synthase [Metabacillus sp. B2-18]|uniref:malonate decarboxylase holo-ACP synthase n=1 Tax=Metabacillus sp. B2-18 TaxID=2897333 RepID=UPI001E5C6CE8|nr:malonate decarboxylase holo-ACP synthase [Metabacillus sp. B2-18]UGB33051.1 malonate decarboxylase holo-ACP synthase [Metabacillus sp. B2-18]